MCSEDTLLAPGFLMDETAVGKLAKDYISCGEYQYLCPVTGDITPAEYFVYP